jgi:hypothetical protein
VDKVVRLRWPVTVADTLVSLSARSVELRVADNEMDESDDMVVALLVIAVVDETWIAASEDVGVTVTTEICVLTSTIVSVINEVPEDDISSADVRDEVRFVAAEGSPAAPSAVLDVGAVELVTVEACALTVIARHQIASVAACEYGSGSTSPSGRRVVSEVLEN